MRKRCVVFYAPHFSEYTFRLAYAMSEITNVRVFLNKKDADRQWPLSSIGELPGKALETVDLSFRRRASVEFPRSVFRVLAIRPDIVHLHETPDIFSAIVAAAAKCLGLRLAVTIHDPSPHSGGGSGEGLHLRASRWLLRRLADVIYAHGEICCREVRARGGLASKAAVIDVPHGPLMIPDIDTAPPAGVPMILFFGRMFQYKGLSVLLDAADILQQDGVSHRICVAGTGPDLEPHRERMRAMDNIRLIDAFISPAAASALYREASVVALPYVDATQSGVAAAAFGNGRAVVASRIGGLPDMIEDGRNGSLVDPGNPGALAAALRLIIEDEGRLQVLTEGARATRRKLDWRAIAATTFDGYDLRHV